MSPRRTRPRAHLAAATLALLAPLAGAQEEQQEPVHPAFLWAEDFDPERTDAPTGRALEDAERTLHENDRAELYPRDEELLRVVGHEMEDNELRAGTPILARAVGGPTQVDADEARERLLAMFEGRLAPSTPLPLSAGARGDGAEPVRHGGGVDPSFTPAEPDGDGGGSWLRWLLLGGLSTAFTVSVLMRRGA